MLSGLHEVLSAARRRGCAAGGFTCYDLATGAGVLAAAEERDAPAILIVSRAAFCAATGPALVAGLGRLAHGAAVPVAVQLDHVEDAATVADALGAGVNAVMADGASRPYAGNVAVVRAAVRLARERGAQVEAELGLVTGDEEQALGAQPAGLTDPAQVARFLDDTGAVCLAVAVGNVHGAYARPPQLDWARLEALADVSAVPLSLHGASGLAAADLTRAVRCGVAKVNVNTALRTAWLAAAADEAPSYVAGARMLAYQERLADRMRDVAAETIEALTL